MTLQLTDNLWNLKIDEIYDANVDKHYLGNFTNNYLVINIQSNHVLSDWRQAGNIGQAIPFNTDLAYGELKQITLDSYLLLNFPLLTEESYDLYYFPLSRLKESIVKVWEYQGTTKDISLQNLIDGLNNNISVNINESNSNVLTKIHSYLTNMEREQEEIDFNDYLPGYY